MNYKSNIFFHREQELFLFDPTKHVKRPTSDQKEFEALIAPFIADIKCSLNETAMALRELHAKNPPHHFLSRFDSMFFNGKFIGILKDTLGVDYFDVNSEGRTYMKLGKYTVFFKKVDSNLNPRNLRTQSTDRIDAQYARISETPSPIVFIGYKPMRGNWSVMDGLYAIYNDKERSKRWVSDLFVIEHIEAINKQVIIDNLISTVDTEQPRIKVRKETVQAM
ncbi:hypothetical protein [Alistipes indistinctus]|uniref:hypothetical protein n=1 Tax=Alistipes indistinctus TaxID=626932 RepID=UPI0015F1CCFE|nr:hypothetical protein [Alistipes indistinctus]BCG54376.1 hypothetical protein AI2BBH_14220 [Alistipes indistinctus]